MKTHHGALGAGRQHQGSHVLLQVLDVVLAGRSDEVDQSLHVLYQNISTNGLANCLIIVEYSGFRC